MAGIHHGVTENTEHKKLFKLGQYSNDDSCPLENVVVCEALFCSAD